MEQEIALKNRETKTKMMMKEEEEESNDFLTLTTIRYTNFHFIEKKKKRNFSIGCAHRRPAAASTSLIALAIKIIYFFLNGKIKRMRIKKTIHCLVISVDTLLPPFGMMVIIIVIIVRIKRGGGGENWN